MRTAGVIVAAGLVLAMAGGARASQSLEERTARLPLEAQAALGALAAAQQRCDEAAPVLRRVNGDPAFGKLPAELRLMVLETSTACAWTAGQQDVAYDYSRRAVQEEAAVARTWMAHTALSLDLGRTADALEIVTTLGRTKPEFLKTFELQLLGSLYAMAETLPKPDDKRLAMLEALDKAGWANSDPFGEPDPFTIERVRLMLGAGRKDDARKAADRLTDPSSIVLLQVDGRYADVAGDARDADVVGAFKSRIGRLKLAQGRHPERLSGPVQLAAAHMALGQNEEALAVVDAALKRVDSMPSSAFADHADFHGRLLGIRAETLARLGRVKDADAAWKLAAETPFRGGTNFDGMFGRASFLIDVDRPQEALAALSGGDESVLSEHGKASLAAMRACAYAETKERAAYERELAIAKTPAANPVYGMLMNALICGGDLDQAAAVTVRRLQEPTLRGEALLALQQVRWPRTIGDHDRRWNETYDRLRARPDVAAAVKAAGGTVRRYEVFDNFGM